jgi:hypothetical protein
MTRPVTCKYIWLRKAFSKLREDFLDICYIDNHRITYDVYGSCDGKLEFAHLNTTELSGRSRGSYERYKDIIQNPDCYILLCKKHHHMFDNGELKL